MPLVYKGQQAWLAIFSQYHQIFMWVWCMWVWPNTFISFTCRSEEAFWKERKNKSSAVFFLVLIYVVVSI